MTKVIPDRTLLEYRQSMAEWVNELRDEKLGPPAKPPLPKDPWQVSYEQKDISASGSVRAGLLTPPRIEWLYVSDYHGQAGDIIQINTGDDFGVEAVHLSIRDEEGNLIESDYALENPDFTGHWVYFASVPVPPNTRITISARAMDSLGGVGIRICQMTTP